MQRKTFPADRTHDALVAFLEQHVGTPRTGDVGPLFGQASVIRDLTVRGDDARSRRLCVDAVNLALTSEAMREAPAARASRRRRAARIVPRAR